MLKIIAKDFSRSPFGRSKVDSKHNGTKFRELFLKGWIEESIKDGKKLTLDFNGLDIPMTSSFMEESFGGLIRFGHFKKETVLEVLDFKSKDETYVEEILFYINDAEYNPDAEMYEM